MTNNIKTFLIIIIITTLFFFPIKRNLNAEMSSEEKSKIHEAGEALSSYSSFYYWGLGLNASGIIITIIGANIRSGEMNTVCLTSGIISSITGIVFMLIAPSKIGKAGKILKEISYKDNNTFIANLNFNYNLKNTQYNLNYIYNF